MALQCGFAVGCEDSEDTGFYPLRIMWCAPEQYMSQEMLNLRRFLARFWLRDNQMTIILEITHLYYLQILQQFLQSVKISIVLCLL